MPAPNPQISDVHRFPALFSEIWLCPIDDTDTIADAQWPTPPPLSDAG